jgi:hypothetical protein
VRQNKEKRRPKKKLKNKRDKIRENSTRLRELKKRD